MQVLRITRGKIQPGTWEQFEATLHEAVEKIGHVPGLVSRSLVRNIEDPNEGYAISIWESMEAIEHYERSELAKTVTPMIQSFFTGDYRCDHCEVRYWDTKA
jgi:heme-degrading monooxygenase HmoA